MSEEEEEEEGEDNEPLSKRAAWNAKHNLPQPTAPARKRNQRFPKIPRCVRKRSTQLARSMQHTYRPPALLRCGLRCGCPAGQASPGSCACVPGSHQRGAPWSLAAALRCPAIGNPAMQTHDLSVRRLPSLPFPQVHQPILLLTAAPLNPLFLPCLAPCRSERCGTCENCLNPQRKKACLVARARMEERMRQSGGAGGSAVAPGARASGASAKPPSPVAAVAASADEDPFARSLTGILSSNGGVAQERHVPLLLQLVKRARSKPHRIALLTVLQLSGGEVLRAAVADGLLLQLQTWLSEFVAEGKQAMVQKALACLDKLPVTLASLQPPCELGKIVGRLRKHESFGSAVIEPAKRLVARWKAMVDAAVKSGAGGSSSRSARARSLPAVLLCAAGPPLDVDLNRRSAAAVCHGPAQCLRQQRPRLSCLATCNAVLQQRASLPLLTREQHA